MVKNKIGGNKAKKFARKNINAASNTIEKKLRFVSDSDEMYGMVTKIIGNGQFIVLGLDGRERLCFIRNKFSGRNKQSNLILSGSWVIVGLRSWETPKANKLEKCDLLEIYDENEKHRLQKESQINFTPFIVQENKMSHIDVDKSNGDEKQNTIVFDYINDDVTTQNEFGNSDLQKNTSKGSMQTHQVADVIDGIDFDEI